MTRRLLIAFCAAVFAIGIGASAAYAGEVTGNGKSLHVQSSKWGTGLHARSFCAFSGQEDLQFFVDEEGDTIPKVPATKGDPGHSQSWGQIPKDTRDFLTTIGLQPGTACNPTKSSGEG